MQTAWGSQIPSPRLLKIRAQSQRARAQSTSQGKPNTIPHLHHTILRCQRASTNNPPLPHQSTEPAHKRKQSTSATPDQGDRAQQHTIHLRHTRTRSQRASAHNPSLSHQRAEPARKRKQSTSATPGHRASAQAHTIHLHHTRAQSQRTSAHDLCS